MSTKTFTETQSVLSTFKPEPRKYDLRTAEGKYFKRLNSYDTEFSVDAGNITVNEEHGYGDDRRIVAVSYPAIHLVRTAEIDSALVETYLKHKLVRNWSSRDKGKASLTVINEALYQERWSGGWQWSLAAAWRWAGRCRWWFGRRWRRSDGSSSPWPWRPWHRTMR